MKTNIIVKEIPTLSIGILMHKLRASQTPEKVGTTPTKTQKQLQPKYINKHTHIKSASHSSPLF